MSRILSGLVVMFFVLAVMCTDTSAAAPDGKTVGIDIVIEDVTDFYAFPYVKVKDEERFMWRQ